MAGNASKNDMLNLSFMIKRDNVQVISDPEPVIIHFRTTRPASRASLGVVLLVYDNAPEKKEPLRFHAKASFGFKLSKTAKQNY